MPHEHISIRTEDGVCRAHVFTPPGTGRWPAVIFFMDGLAIRPQLFSMATRLSEAGYVVLLPDMFYRFGPYEPLDPRTLFANGSVRQATADLLSSTDNAKAAADTAAFLSYLAGRDDVAGLSVGTTGYCMGGAMSLTAAGKYPHRIAAAASFHGGYLATDSASSPHLLASTIRGRVYVGAAVEDPSYPPDMAGRLEQALLAAGVAHCSETYAGARHGWTMADFPVYDEPAAERHWRKLLELFDETLR